MIRQAAKNSPTVGPTIVVSAMVIWTNNLILWFDHSRWSFWALFIILGLSLSSTVTHIHIRTKPKRLFFFSFFFLSFWPNPFVVVISPLESRPLTFLLIIIRARETDFSLYFFFLFFLIEKVLYVSEEELKEIKNRYKTRKFYINPPLQFQKRF